MAYVAPSPGIYDPPYLKTDNLCRNNQEYQMQTHVNATVAFKPIWDYRTRLRMQTWPVAPFTNMV